jgi:hypothetical protein
MTPDPSAGRSGHGPGDDPLFVTGRQGDLLHRRGVW